MAIAATPTIDVVMDDDTVNIVSKVAFFNHVIKIKVGGEVEQTFEGLKMKVKCPSHSTCSVFLTVHTVSFSQYIKRNSHIKITQGTTQK